MDSPILLGLPEIFAKDYEQIAYLDTDVFLKSGKVSDLLKAADPDFAVSGVVDCTQWHGAPRARQNEYWRAMGLIDLPYLNTGVLVLNVKKTSLWEVFLFCLGGWPTLTR